MENASKALIMAAGVLLGVMLISFFVYLFLIFGTYSKNTADEMANNKIQEFNNQFLKYYGTEQRDDPYERTYTKTDETVETYSYNGPILCTSHDIVTLAKLAKDNNNNFNFYSEDANYNGSTVENDLYIEININGISKGNNVEKWTADKLNNFIKDNDIKMVKSIPRVKYFYIDDAIVNNNTKIVEKITFMELNIDNIPNKYVKK